MFICALNLHPVNALLPSLKIRGNRISTPPEFKWSQTVKVLLPKGKMIFKISSNPNNSVISMVLLETLPNIKHTPLCNPVMQTQLI